MPVLLISKSYCVNILSVLQNLSLVFKKKSSTESCFFIWEKRKVGMDEKFRLFCLLPLQLLLKYVIYLNTFYHRNVWVGKRPLKSLSPTINLAQPGQYCTVVPAADFILKESRLQSKDKTSITAHPHGTGEGQLYRAKP